MNALGYVLGNQAHHFGGVPGDDPFSSGTYDVSSRKRVLATPVGWLLRVGWLRAPRMRQWLTNRLSLATDPGCAAAAA